MNQIHAAAPRPPARYKAVLPMNRCLHVGDVVVSANGMFSMRLGGDGQLRVFRGGDGQDVADVLWSSGRSGEGDEFFALVQTDGNFCVYRGGDLQSNRGWQWGSQLTADGAQFHALLQDDGLLCVCKGESPAHGGGEVWSSGVADPIARIDSVSAIDYHFASATLVQARPADLYRETVSNGNEQVQTSMISGSVTVSDTTGWSDELAAGVPAPAAFKGRVPVVSGGKIVLSADASHGYLRNGAATTARTWGFNAPAAVPPTSSMMCLVSAMRSTIVVPYTLSGTFTLRSGRQVTGSLRGSYTGTNCHDLTVTLTTYDPKPAGSYSISRPLTPMPSISGPATPHSLTSTALF